MPPFTCPTVETERLLLRPFREDDLDAYTAVLRAEPVRRALHLPDTIGRREAWGQMAMILPENRASQAVARRLGFTLAAERVLSTFPSAPHGILQLARSTWISSSASSRSST